MMRRLFGFWGGIKPDSHKNESTRLPVAKAPLPSLLTVPLRQNAGASPRIMVKAGDPVLKGQMIAAPEDGLSVALHAPTSGHVRAIEARAIAHPSGLAGICAIIEPDGAERWVELEPLDAARTSPEQLRRRLREAGLVGMGGAAFPSYVKAGGTAIDTLIINGAECEPWITCDDRLMRERAAKIVLGIEVMAHTLGVKTILIGIEDNKPEALAAMSAAAPSGMEVVAVPTGYPGGGGKQLTYTLTGVETPTGGRSTDAGIQVFNVGTAYSLYRAVYLGEPLLSRVVTVTGHVANPGNFEARIGTPMTDLLAAAGGALDGADGEIVGGPMMGFDLMDQAAPVTKSVNCLIVKDPVRFPPPPTPLPCIRCGACARACPADLQPFEMYWFSRAKDFGKAQSYNLFDCIECGCCAYVCPSHIPLVDFFRFAKSEIWEREQEKHGADQARQRHEFKEFRLEREKREKAEKFARAAEKNKEAAATTTTDATADPDAEKKKAILQAALDRAKKAKEAVTPRNTDNLPPRVEKEIAEIEARRAQAEAKTESGEG